jgi:hypothetical protein
LDIVETQPKSNAAKKSPAKVDNIDIILLDNEDGFIPDSLSPRTRSGRKIPMSEKVWFYLLFCLYFLLQYFFYF